MIAVFTALKEERQAVRRAWGLSAAGTLQGLELEAAPGIVGLCSGMGPERMERAVRLAHRVFKPEVYLLAGFSAGLRPDLKVGDLVVDGRGDCRLLQGIDAPHLLGEVATCGLLRTHAQKLAFAEKHPGAPVADLESEAFLAAVPPGAAALVVRAVSDELTHDLPLDFTLLVDKRGFPALGSIAMKVVARPLLLRPLLELGRNASLAAAALQQFLAEAGPLLTVRRERVHG